jgi:hypothetical protein
MWPLAGHDIYILLSVSNGQDLSGIAVHLQRLFASPMASRHESLFFGTRVRRDLAIGAGMP